MDPSALGYGVFFEILSLTQREVDTTAEYITIHGFIIWCPSPVGFIQKYALPQTYI